MMDNLVYISEYLEDFLPDLEIISSLFHSIECGESSLDYCYLIMFFSEYIPNTSTILRLVSISFTFRT